MSWGLVTGAIPLRSNTPASRAVVGSRRNCCHAMSRSSLTIRPRFVSSLVSMYPAHALAKHTARTGASGPVETNGQPVLGTGERRPVDRHHVVARHAPAVPEQQLVHGGLDLHAAEVQPDALVHPVAERDPRVAVHLVVRAEPVGVELVGVGPVLLEVVQALQTDRDVGVRRDPVAEDLSLLDGLAGQTRYRRHETHALPHHTI